MINQKHAAKTHLPVGLSEEKRKTWKRKSGLIYQTLEIHIKKGLNRTGLESRFIITITSRGQGALACGMDAGSSLAAPAAARCWLRGTAMGGCCWPTCWPFSCCSPSAEPSYPSSTRCCSKEQSFQSNVRSHRLAGSQHPRAALSAMHSTARHKLEHPQHEA